MKTLLLALALSLCSLAAYGQQVYPENHSTSLSSGLVTVPATAATLTSASSVYVRQYYFSNPSYINGVANTTTVTVSLYDGSTNCNGAACYLLSTSIAPGGVVSLKLDGIPAVGGLKWLASVANTVEGFVQWTY